MLFTSVSYMIFLPLVFLLYWLLPHKYRWVLLLVASYYFYTCWNAKFIVLIVFTTIVSYFGAIKVEKTVNKSQKKIWLTISIIICLGLLIYFKYFNFLATSITEMFKFFIIPIQLPTYKIILPIGLSFYTFQILGYLIDVYRGSANAETHLGKYAVFVSYFPKLLSGPIETTNTLFPQIHKEQSFSYDQSIYGIKLIAWGLFKKIVIADTLASYVNAAYGNIWTTSENLILTATLAFAIQLYADFSGYIDIASGSSKILGINLSKNFDSPYFSASIKEFWRRWHITLGSWFKNYLFYPILRTKTCSSLSKICSKWLPKYYAQKVPVVFALLIVWFFMGLWHGASWNFIIFGLYYAILMIIGLLFAPLDKEFISKFKINTGSDLYNLFKVLWTFLLVCFGYIFFRTSNLFEAYYVISNLNHIDLSMNFHYSVKNIYQIFLFMGIGLLFIYDYLSLKYDVIDKIKTLNFVFRWMIYYFIVGATLYFILYTNLSASNFVYFQF